MSLRNDQTKADLTVAEQKALEIIKNERAAVKVVTPNDDFILNQISKPDGNRPSRSKHFYLSKFNMDRPEAVTKFNPSPYPNTTTNPHLEPFAMHDHEFGKCYERKHGEHYTHTKKTAVSFIPSDPRYMRLFTSPGHVGLLWDIESCDLKEGRYLFGDNDTAPWSDTDWCNWLDIKSESRPDESEYKKSRCTINEAKAQHSTSVEEFREINRRAIESKTRLSFNEWLAGLPKGRVDAVFHIVDNDLGKYFEEYRDNPAARLKTWDYMLFVKEKLGLRDNIPVVIFSEDKPVRVYTETDRNNDLKYEPSFTHQDIIKPNTLTLNSDSLFSQHEDSRTPEYHDILEALAKIRNTSLTEEVTNDVQLALITYITTAKNPFRLLQRTVPLMKRFGLESIHMLFEHYQNNPYKFQQYCSEMKNLQVKFPNDVVFDRNSFREAIEKTLSKNINKTNSNRI